MSNPTRQETTDAHKALGRLCHLADNPPLFVFKDPHEVSELRQTILKALPANLKPTMDEIEWDDDKHRFAEAEHPAWGKVVMLNNDGGVYIQFLRTSSGQYKWDYDFINKFTPTGKRYTLAETQA